MYRLRSKTKTHRQSRASTDRVKKVNILLKQLATMRQQYNYMKKNGDDSKRVYYYEQYIQFLSNRIDANLKYI